MGAVATLAIAAVLAVWLLPRFQARRWKAQGIGDKEVADLENSARATLVQIFGGIALILTFVATWLQITDTREATDRTLQLTSAHQETERFTRAVDQLGSARLEVRIGGMLSLQQVAHDSPGRRRPVAELMLAYLKTHHRVRQHDPRTRRLELRNRAYKSGAPVAPACASTVAYPAPDAQAALGVLLAMPTSVRPHLDFADVSLVGVRLPSADLSGADLREASLAGAYLPRAKFDRARIYQTDLRRACLRGARFGRAVFNFPNAVGADLTDADLSQAKEPFTIQGPYDD